MCNKNIILYLENSLKQYEETRKDIDETSILLGQTDAGCIKQILDEIQILYKLTYNGKTIKELYQCQKNPRNKEYESTIYVIKNSDKQPMKEEKVKEQPKRQGCEKKSDSNRNGKQSTYFFIKF